MQSFLLSSPSFPWGWPWSWRWYIQGMAFEYFLYKPFCSMNNVTMCLPFYRHAYQGPCSSCPSQFHFLRMSCFCVWVFYPCRSAPAKGRECFIWIVLPSIYTNIDLLGNYWLPWLWWPRGTARVLVLLHRSPSVLAEATAGLGPSSPRQTSQCSKFRFITLGPRIRPKIINLCHEQCVQGREILPRLTGKKRCIFVSLCLLSPVSRTWF